MIRRNTFRPIDRLDSRHLLSIILCIGENGGCRKVDIYENVSWNTNMPKKIRELEDMNPIGEENGGNLYLVNGNMIPITQANQPSEMQNTAGKEEAEKNEGDQA